MTTTWIVCVCGIRSRIAENTKAVHLRRDLEKEGWTYWNGTDRCAVCAAKHRAYLESLGRKVVDRKEVGDGD